MAIAFGLSASLSGLFSARPSPDAGQVGRFYFATDTSDLYRDSGTAWVLIGTARTYKVYTALLTQTGTNAPVATVLENTLGGTVVLSRDSAGDYRATLAGAFTSGKTFVIPPESPIFDVVIYIRCYRADDNTIYVQTYDQNGDGEDGRLSNYPIEIRVYP